MSQRTFPTGRKGGRRRSNRRGATVLMGVLCAWLGLAFAPWPLAAQSEETPYSLIGDAGFQNDFNDKSWALDDSSARWTAAFFVEAKHRYVQERYEFSVHHLVNISQNAAPGPISLATTVYEAYALFKPADGFDLYLGQKRMNIGVGQTVTVGDSYNPSVGFFDQKTGAKGLLLNLSLGSWLGVSAGLSLDKVLESAVPNSDLAVYGAQASVLWDRLQLVSGAVYRKAKTFNTSLGLSYDLGGVILTAEGAGEFLPQVAYPNGSGPVWSRPGEWTEPRWSASAGARYTYTGDELTWTGACEYLYSGQGYTDAEDDLWKTLPESNATAIGFKYGLRPSVLLNQHYLFPKLVLGWEDWFGLTNAVFVNLTDGSLLFSHSLSWSPWEGLDLVASGRWSGGGGGTEWERIPAAPGSAGDVLQIAFQTKIHF